MTAPICRWLAGSLTPDVDAALLRIASTDDVVHVAVMPDVHLAEDVCIGTVVATTHLIYPAAVGGDIGCGVAALRFNGAADVLRNERTAAQMLARLYEIVPAIHHPVARCPKVPAELDAAHLSDPQLDRLKSRDGRLQFATLGRGNHFLEFQADEHGDLWLMLHSGSRAMGQAIRNRHLRHAAASATQLLYLDVDTVSGKEYLDDVVWALRYAEESRRAMAAAVAELLRDVCGIDADWNSFFTCNHNHVRKEMHEGRVLWVHRKGAIPAGLGERGIIPGSMGSPSFHVEGRGDAQSLCSSSHGAGRALSRSEARRRITKRDFVRQL